jgi:hypothetical protein
VFKHIIYAFLAKKKREKPNNTSIFAGFYKIAFAQQVQPAQKSKKNTNSKNNQNQTS